MRRAAPLLAAVALSGAVGCGGGEKGSGELRWAATPRIFRSADLPHDRVLQGTVENGTLRRIEIKAKDLRLVDSRGHRVGGVATFLNGYLHGLYPPTREPPKGLPAEEKRRLGIVARIDPGKRAPLTLAWRLKAGERPPARVEYGAGSLPIPAR
jgi:hypothetical protein